MKLFYPFDVSRQSLGVLLLLAGLAVGCSVAEPKISANVNTHSSSAANSGSSAANSNSSQGATIPLDPNGPADTVRVFYKLLREKKFREALFLTNLKPAIAGLTDMELKEFSVDFEAIAGQVPTEVEINGEMITGDKASVTANLPNEDGDKNELQTLNLRKENDIWIILTVDDKIEERIKKEGKNYFYALRIETHEDEAKKMLERISKAELAHSLQNGGLFTDMQTLVTAGLLPEDITTSESTGYNYAINVAGDKKKYFATATPAVYGKSGKLSYILELDGKGISRVSNKDNGGKPIRK